MFSIAVYVRMYITNISIRVREIQQWNNKGKSHCIAALDWKKYSARYTEAEGENWMRKYMDVSCSRALIDYALWIIEIVLIWKCQVTLSCSSYYLHTQKFTTRARERKKMQKCVRKYEKRWRSIILVWVKWNVTQFIFFLKETSFFGAH